MNNYHYDTQHICYIVARVNAKNEMVFYNHNPFSRHIISSTPEFATFHQADCTRESVQDVTGKKWNVYHKVIHAELVEGK